MSSSCSLSGDVPEGPASPQTVGHHPQFPGLLTLIDGRVVAYISSKNQFGEPKKIPYVVPILSPTSPRGLPASIPLP